MERKLNKFSRTLAENEDQPGSQAMLYGIDLDETTIHYPQVGIASAGLMGNPCNLHLNQLGELVIKGLKGVDINRLMFNTISVSDAMTMGTEGMKYSLTSRDLIADSIEAVVNAYWYDGLITIMGCDKNMPGAIMAMARLNRPSLMIYGGSIHSGKHHGKKINILSTFEAYGAKVADHTDEQKFKSIIRNACPGAGSCGGMSTANTMSSSIETMGLSLPYSSSYPANSNEKKEECISAAKALKVLLELDLKPRDIITRSSLENAIVTVMALGGSTNAVLHYLAIARAFGISLTLADFQAISDKTPLIADMKPSGQYLMEDVHESGGTPAILKILLDQGLLNGDCMTVTGKTISENLKDITPWDNGKKILHSFEQPIKQSGHLQILFGNMAQHGSVAKITGKEDDFFQGRAKVFNKEGDAINAVKDRKIWKGDVVVIRYEGPKGAPGMPEMLKVTAAVMGAGLGKDAAILNDGRFSGGTHGFVVGHICPEAQEGGLICILQDGDTITIDVRNNQLNVDLSDKEIRSRYRTWIKPNSKYLNGILYKYSLLVSSASDGFITNGISINSNAYEKK